MSDLKVEDYLGLLEDPLCFQKLCWPDMLLYDKQIEIIKSVEENDETVVVAGNQLGKDFITGFIVLWFYCSRSPCHIITSSAGQTQLKSVLWGEIRNFIQSSVIPLPLKVNDLALSYIKEDGTIEPKSYVLGIVTNTPENMQGHHLARGPNAQPRTLAIFDEASGIADEYSNAAETWAHRKLVIGNPLPCNNFFFNAVEQGDIPRDNGIGFHRKVIQIKAEHSPNVRLAREEIALGKEPSRTTVIPGVVSWDDYCKRRKLWDLVRQSVGLDAEFYKGAEVLLYPPDWLNAAEERNREIKLGRNKRNAKAMGCDTAEGGDSTVWTVVDELGIIEQISMKTSDTSDIPGKTISLINKYNLLSENVLFDIGGGGKQHADNLRKLDYNVQTIAFGGSPTPSTVQPNSYAKKQAKEEGFENRQTYKNKRAEMYGILRDLLDPNNDAVFAIPDTLTELRRQLAPLPLLYDGEGKMYLPPKDKPSANYTGMTIRQIIGCSPDEADSLVLATYGLTHTYKPTKVGVLF